jgi:hypothetical protein
MLNKTLIMGGGRTEHVPYEKTVNTNINEHRAPTDKSVELLKEFQDKAKDTLVEHIYLDDNVFKARIDVMDLEYGHTREYRLHFKLNGKEFKDVIKLQPRQTMLSHKERALAVVELAKGFIKEKLLNEVIELTIIPMMEHDRLSEDVAFGGSK